MRSSATTLALSYVAFGIAALVLFAAPLWYAWRVTIQDSRTELLRVDAQRFAEVFRREGATGLTAFINTRVGMQIAGERILLLTDPGLHPLAGNLPAWPANIPTRAGIYTRDVTLSGHQTQAMFVHTVLPGGYNLLVGRDQALFAPLTTRFWYGLAAAVAVLSIAGALGGLMIRRAVLVRVDGIRHAVLAIMQGDLSHRLPTHRSSDELDTLARMINGMLEQIEQLVHGVRDVSNSIAHDLRTPLAELRSRLEELSLTRPQPEEAFAEIDAAVADVDRVIGVFNALLRLAQIDAGMRRSGFVGVDATELARQAVEFYLPAAELKGIALSFVGGGPARVSGDPVLLAQAVGNLIDNALKYAGEDGTVEVEVSAASDGRTRICVADHGPGIPDAEKPKVPGRFYRGDVSRGTPGVGLGLSLVESVARLHGGALELLDNHPGLRAQMAIATGKGGAGRERPEPSQPQLGLAPTGAGTAAAGPGTWVSERSAP
ncbi:MAG TPA: HAMP domain-containing sensor histidine kinase [Steroidobacteraceae bacterium]|nr:HAMP domain-containing sensor histidine kinase [Steroidobacteraceae bacterium]